MPRLVDGAVSIVSTRPSSLAESVLTDRKEVLEGKKLSERRLSMVRGGSADEEMTGPVEVNEFEPPLLLPSAVEVTDARRRSDRRSADIGDICRDLLAPKVLSISAGRYIFGSNFQF
jgi:hypothetical protein